MISGDKAYDWLMEYVVSWIAAIGLIFFILIAITGAVLLSLKVLGVV
jgi:hypothetical protein